jgi:hypothetical protein
MTFKNLTVQAGPTAMKMLRRGSLKPERIQAMAGAAGGPKWLVLNAMDRFLFVTWLRDRTTPLPVLGSSIGAWRFAAVSREDPLAGIDAFEHAYLNIEIDAKPSPLSISEASYKVLYEYVDAQGVRELLNHRYLRLNVITTRTTGLVATECSPLTMLGLAGAALANVVSRHLLELFFDRVLFHHPDGNSPFYGDKANVIRCPLDAENLVHALQATASVPLVMHGVPNIPHVPAGNYRDGGVMDYHLDVDYGVDVDRVVLYPHYTDRIVPGWLDKSLTWRLPRRAYIDRVVLISPSADFVDRLPDQKIPDRKDFHEFGDDTKGRVAYWRKSLDLCRQLGDDLADFLAHPEPIQFVKPLEFQG